MSTAIVISLLAVALSLGAALMAAQSKKAMAAKKPDSGDGSSSSVSTMSSTDCGPGDAGCDGGGD